MTKLNLILTLNDPQNDV